MKWQYALTVEEEALATRIGFERQLPMLGQPERNRNYSEGDVWETWQHMIAVGSEIAAARMLGHFEYVPDVNTFKSKYDIPGYEVRYSFARPNGQQLRFSSRVDDLDAVYILIIGGLEVRTRRQKENNWQGNPYQAIGWAYGYDIKQPEYRYLQSDSYYLPMRETYPMEVLPEN